MSALKIFDTDSAKASDRPRQDFSNDVVGRFRSGYVINNKPQSLDAFRVTTGDPDVANRVHELLGGDEPQEWTEAIEAGREETLEVFTAASKVQVILEGDDPVRSKMVLRNMNGEIVRSGDGQILDYPDEVAGQPDPQAGQTFRERKEAARAGMGAKPETSVFFRLAADPDLGKFRFQTGSWDFVSDLHYYDTLDRIADITADGKKVRAVLGLEEVSFKARNGKRAGQTVRYKKPTLEIVGEIED